MSRTIARALRIRRYDVVSEILRRGGSILARSESLAVMAVVAGHAPTLRLLLDHGCPASMGAAETAVATDRLDMFVALMAAGCAPTVELAERVAEQWPLEVFAYLVQDFGLPIPPDLPLVAVRKRDVELLSFSLDRGCSVGSRVLVETAQSRCPRLLREVLRSPDVSAPLCADVVCAAILSDDRESTEILLEFGSELDETVTVLAAFQGRADILRAVVEAGSPVTPDAERIARECGHESSADWLTDRMGMGVAL